MFQFPTKANAGIPQVVNLTTSAKSCNLPDSYAIVPAVALKKATVVSISIPSEIASKCLKEEILTENSWLEQAIEQISQSEVEKGDKISWEAYHACHYDVDISCITLSQVMPLFYEKAASAAMVKHGMTVQFKAI